MKIDTTTVRLVLAIVEEGSISRASDKLNLAVAAASRRVSDLEQQLGATLFRRVPHGVQITEAGDKLLQYIRQIDNLVDRLEGDAQALKHGLDGRIIIGAPKAVIIEFLARDIAGLQRKYPGISLKIVEENSKIVQQLLRDKIIDIGIYEKKSGFLDLPQSLYRQDQLVLVYSRPHFRFAEKPLGIDDILDIPIVSLGKGSAILSAVQRAYRSRGRHFPNNFTANGFDTMLAMVRHGLGVGLMPPEVLRSFHPEETLGSMQLEGDWHHRSYVLSAVDWHAQEQTLRNVVAELLAHSPAE
ncbi:DNA-binding transcriptional LysR family regulator [Trinickia symbiotica]|uniref:LysR family transcriptional regulator n=1 Tax=Trinickia symbiotica TaxID=863227 RepID=A0A2N7X7E8_9BURK|nr:LysR family transcriptional regulator [Trinickia symbiotica]PMS37462.1 LysR family transcriptional regulator [Trinickia symbiotica]PPK42805.1 DNA-binding transcriptional LysR family regulator [Trinickia symbiotica]